MITQIFLPVKNKIYLCASKHRQLCDDVLGAGEYSHTQILDWLGENPDAVTVSDDPERTGLDADMMTVKPDMLSLCEIARGSLSMAVNPAGLKINYYRAPQGVN